MKNFYKKFGAFVFFSVFALQGLSAFTQYAVVGQNPAIVGNTYTYSCTKGSGAWPSGTTTWSASGGTVISYYIDPQSKNVAYATIRWDVAYNDPSDDGLNMVSVSGGTASGSSVITVTCNVTPAPTFTVSPGATACSPTVFSLYATAGSGTAIRWYTASGTTPFLTGESYTTPTLSANTTYYISAYNTTTTCTSAKVAVPLTFPVVPPPPTAPMFEFESLICGSSGSSQISAYPTGNGNLVRWYSSPSGGIPFYTGSMYNTPTLSAQTTYYITSYNSSPCGSESSPRTPVVVKIYPIPSPPNNLSNQSVCGPSAITLSATPGANSEGVYWADNSQVLGFGNTILAGTVSATTTFYARSVIMAAEGWGCRSSPSSLTVTVNPVSPTPASSSLSFYEGDAMSLTTSGYPAGGNLNWYDTNNHLLYTGINYPVTLTFGKYTYRVKSVGVGGICESPGYAVVSVNVTSNLNWIKETTVLAKGKMTKADVDAALIQNGEKSITWNYFDGLGRPMQSVSVQASPLGMDIVQPVTYDAFGRENKKYLPYTSSQTQGNFKINAINEQYAFYQTGGLTPSDLAPYAEARFETSPLDRVIKQGAPGTAWQPDATNTYTSADRTVKFNYDVNVALDSVLNWIYTYPTATYPLGLVNASNGATPVYYGPNVLVKTKTKDEQNNEVIEFTDKQGKVILKKVRASANSWAQTYYVYNNFNKPVCVLSPEAVRGIIKNPSAYFNQADGVKEAYLKQWCFRYRYDGRQLMSIKQVPGADSVLTVYDGRDRLAMTQDGEQRKTNKWSYTNYDALNRPIITGIYTHTTAVNQSTMSGLISTTNFYETYTGDVANHGYSNTVFSSSNFPGSFEVLTVTYYDNYNFRNLWTGTYSYASDGLSATVANGAIYTQPTVENQSVTGHLTGSKVKVLDGAATWLKSISYYDDKYRTVQTISDNIKGGTDRMSNLSDFTGRNLKTKTTHSIAGGTSQNIVRNTVYDHGRPTKTWHSINGATPVLLAQHDYNELGQVIDKKLHSTDNGSTFKQSIDYRYNIRSWVTSINNSSLASDAGVTNDDTNDLFGMNLLYNQLDAGLNNAAQFNGNISAMKWSTNLGLDAIKQRAYNFSYDPMNRLQAASHNELTTAWNASTSYHENGLQYDLNGNIRTLNRKGASGANMDQLAYTYNGNQLVTVSDAGDITKGFVDGNIGSTDYTYDANGNMIVDKNKGITAIAYNHLNLPGQVNKSTGDYIKYIYDATGKKLSQQVFSPSGAPKKKTDYVGDFFYQNDTLKFINHEEGRIVMTGAQPEYQYNLKDHLGNVRVTFTTQPVSQSSTATFETTAQNTEAGKFSNYPSGGYVNTLPTNANTGTNSEYLNGGYHGQIGIAKSFSVMPGDQVQIQAYAKYNPPSATPVNYTNFVTSLLSAFALTAPTGGETGTAGWGVNNFGTWEIGPTGDESKNDPLKVFVTIIMFDRNYNFLDVAYASPTASGALFSASYTARQPGYAYLYVSNEHPTFVDVYVDDVTMSFTPSPVVQMDDFMPFGLTFNSYQRESSVPNKFKFQGQEHVDDLGLNWDSFKWRNHQPDIGRFFNIDPLADKYVYNSPYAFSENKVVAHVELEGLESVGIEAIDMVDAMKPKPAPATGGGKVLNGLGNVFFGTVGAIGSGAYIIGSEGVGAPLGGGTAIALSLGEVAIGFAQIADGISEMNGGNSDKSGVLQKSSSLPGLIGNAAGSEQAPMIDALGQFIPGMLSGGNIKTILEAPKVIFSSKSAPKAVENILNATDAVLDTKGVIDAARSPDQPSGGTPNIQLNANKPDQIPDPNKFHGIY